MKIGNNYIHFKGSDDPKIIGGNTIGIEKVPYQVSLQGISRETGDYQHYCGGSIISNRHILTAAHCLFGYPKELISVVVGTASWNGDNGERHFVEQYYTHPMYKELQGNDIAVIKLETEVVFNEKVKYYGFAIGAFLTISIIIQINKIALNDEEHVPQDNESCIVSGWGYTFPIRAPDFIPYWLLQSINLYPIQLKMAEVQTISNEKCRHVFSYMTLDTELCTLKWSEGACSVRIVSWFSC